MAETRYIPLEQRAEWLIRKTVQAWQELQRFAMAEDELLDSVVLLGQELRLPHHETDGRQFRVTLQLALHYASENRAAAEQQVNARFRELEEKLSDEQGALKISTIVR